MEEPNIRITTTIPLPVWKWANAKGILWQKLLIAGYESLSKEQEEEGADSEKMARILRALSEQAERADRAEKALKEALEARK